MKAQTVSLSKLLPRIAAVRLLSGGKPIPSFLQLLPAEKQAPLRAVCPPLPANHTSKEQPHPMRTPLDHLREKLWLKPLPDSVEVPTGPGGSPVITKPVAEATVDDIAFAMTALSRQSVALHRQADALRQIHDLARRAGAVGTANAAAAAARVVDIAE